MMIGNTNDPTGAATPIVGPGNNSCTDCITIPLEEYKKLIECSVNMDIIDRLAGDKDIYRTLVTGPDVVPRDEYNKLLNVSAKRFISWRRSWKRQRQIRHISARSAADSSLKPLPSPAVMRA